MKTKDGYRFYGCTNRTQLKQD